MNNTLESVQYSAALAVTGAIQGTSRSKLYKKLRLGSLESGLSGVFVHFIKLYLLAFQLIFPA